MICPVPPERSLCEVQAARRDVCRCPFKLADETFVGSIATHARRPQSNRPVVAGVFGRDAAAAGNEDLIIGCRDSRPDPVLVSAMLLQFLKRLCIPNPNRPVA